ncbi:hypothetical protein AALP_AA4G212500 [Arabis alpina]|uniref:MATH domain-containing protein n=1 Tax=Arabis alpina TaxID=50452 RepID=A0A087H4P3_ARAAL|nr:hypothetical protein AALP_AA4G212500 [Arabis alpina]
MKTFSWEIDNFSERNDVFFSDPFSSGGCEWCLCVFPEGNVVDDHLSLFLFVMDPESLLPGWKRRAIFRFVLSNHSGKELHKTTEERKLFTAEAPGWGYHRMLPLSKLQEEGFLEDDKLTIQVYMKVVEVILEGKSTKTDMVVINGFHVLNTQAISVSKIFAQHPDVAVDIRSDIKEVKTTYMNILLGLIETLSQAPESLSETEISKAELELSELTEGGFRLGWLMSKLDEISLERNKTVSNGFEVVQKPEDLEKYVELSSSDVEVEQDKEKTDSAGVPKVSSFDFLDFLFKRCFLSCFSFSRQ